MKHATRFGALWERARRPVTVLSTAEIGALWGRARKPLTMFAIGAGLAVPASAFVMREDAAKAEEAASSASVLGAVNSEYASAERADAAMTLGLSRLYDVPVGLAVQIHKAASTEGIPSRLAFGLVRTESEFKRTAVSPVGAVGLTQVMPSTAKWFRKGTTRQDLFDSQTNLHIGFKYLHQLIDKYDGDVRLALTAYNRGPGVVDKLVKRGRDPENGYATKVLADPATLKLPADQARTAPADETSVTTTKHHARSHRTAHHARKAVKHHHGKRHAQPAKRKKRHRR